MKTPKFLLLSLAVTSVFSSDAFASEPSKQLLNQAKHSVVVITTFTESGRPLLQGSGFFISENQVVTSLHVLRGAAAILMQPYRGKSITARRIALTVESLDLAVIETETPSAPVTLLRIEPSRPQDGEALFVVSNPRGSPRKVTRGTVDSFWNFENSGDLMRITAALAPGSSGGPVMNLRGDVIGIAVSHAEYGEELNFAIPGAAIAALACQNPSKTLLSSASATSPSTALLPFAK